MARLCGRPSPRADWPCRKTPLWGTGGATPSGGRSRRRRWRRSLARRPARRGRTRRARCGGRPCTRWRCPRCPRCCWSLRSRADRTRCRSCSSSKTRRTRLSKKMGSFQDLPREEEGALCVGLGGGPHQVRCDDADARGRACVPAACAVAGIGGSHSRRRHGRDRHRLARARPRRGAGVAPAVWWRQGKRRRTDGGSAIRVDPAL